MEIRCAVENCTFNIKLKCTARMIEVNCDDTTMLAANTKETCCGTFNLLEDESDRREEMERDDIDVKCTVTNCEFFKRHKCFAISLEVKCDDGSNMAANREETCCDTFSPWWLNKEEFKTDDLNVT